MNTHDLHEVANHDNGRARFLMEQGDMGYRPGQRFPLGLGDSEQAQIWRAVMGASEEEHDASLRYAAMVAERSSAQGFDWKIISKPKLGKFRTHDARRYQITEVSLADPFILPRHITAPEFVNLYSAVSYVNSKGFALNVHLTICWRDLGFSVDDASTAQSALYRSFIKQFTEWCRYQDIDCVWIFSNEFSEKVGLHTHFMTMVNEGDWDLLRKFVARRLGKINRKRELSKTAFKLTINRKRVLQRQWIQFQYLCKGVDPHERLAHANGFDSIPLADLIRFGYENPGAIRCKRSGLSRNIDKWVRQQVGFRSLMEQGQLNVDLLYPECFPAESSAWQPDLSTLLHL